MLKYLPAPARRRSARGFSLVELMVGIAVGMFVVAAASIMATSQLTDNRRLLLETQLQQDLRSAADLVARDLRRAGYSESASSGISSPSGSVMVANAYSTLYMPSSTDHTVRYDYRRGAGAGSFGFWWNPTDGVLRACQSDHLDTGCPSSGWQELTDPATVKVTDFSIDTTRASPRAHVDNDNAITIACPALCADGTATCWPKVSVRELVVTISGQARSDSRVNRTLQVSVRVRNDKIEFSTEAAGGGACPLT